MSRRRGTIKTDGECRLKGAVIAGGPKATVMVTKEKAIYTVREAAAILCVTPRTVRSYIAERKLRAIQRGDGYYLIHADDLRVFLGLDPDETLATVSIPDG